MKPAFEVFGKVQKPVSDVFDAVYNPVKLSGYFTTAGASGPMDAGSTVTWDFADFPGAFPVKIVESIKDLKLVFEWQAKDREYNTTVRMDFEEDKDGSTSVKISEWGWEDNDQDHKNAFGNCQGWSQMISCLKAYLEYGINLRKGFYK